MNCLTLDIVDHVASITLSRPPMNTLTRESYLEIEQTFRSLGSLPGIRAAVLRAQGNVFCAGNDVREFQAIGSREEADVYAGTVSDALVSVYECEVPVVAAVQGHAMGAGMALAACADVIVAAEGVRFGIPEIRVGVIGASGFLALLVPEKVVRYLSLTGNSVTAEEVRAWGGVHAVVPGDDVLDNALSIAREISQRGPTAVRYFKQAMNINFDARLAEKYATEMSFTGRYVGTEESLESIAAFLENRPPRYD